MSNLTEEEALKEVGEIYRHYKGGIYRLVLQNVKHTETGEIGVLYEHLWPHQHGYYFRPESLFFGSTEDGKQRFTNVADNPVILR